MVRRAAEELLRRKAREDLLAFMVWSWWGPTAFRLGRHTRAICRRLTQAAEDLKRGKSTYLVISLPFRHGKSELAKGFCAWALGACAELQPSCLEACYNAELAIDFSKQIRAIIRSEAYQDLFPGIRPSRGSDRADLWQLEASQSRFRATGLIKGSATGFGANIIVVDDYLRGYSESRSKVTKKAILNAFATDIFTRQNAPACIVLVIATQWADDDLIGAIDKESGVGQRFHGFEFLRFPARKEGEWDILFPEMYDAKWYDTQRSSLGPRMAAALLDCAPRPDEGGRFKPLQQVRFHDTLEAWPAAMRECRAWDLASSAKERDGDDPDYTWGVRLGITGNKATGYEVWIRGAVSGRWEAPERNAIIRQTAMEDSTSVRQYVESFGAYKDAVNEIKAVLRGVRVVKGIRLPGDKTVKASILEPIFDAQRIHVYRGGMSPEVLERWVTDFAAFPEGAHDDAVDATALAVHALASGSGSTILM
jgi:predicted phage terminase large subunit-like protein